MRMNFKGLNFELIDGRIVLTDCLGFGKCIDENKKSYFDFVEVQIAGENHSAHCGAKMFESSEWNKLKYISYAETNNLLEIVQGNSLITVVSSFEAYEDTKVIRVYNTVTNMSDKPITLEHISSFACYGFGKEGTDSVKNLFLYKFYSSWHIECQPVRLSFYDLGLFNGNERCMKRISGCNTGSWSTKEELPQSIIEDTDSGSFFMFQIESNNSWYYELGDNAKLIYLNIGGANTTFNQWSKTLQPNCDFETTKVAITVGSSINEVLGDFTKYRRKIVRRCNPDKQLPVIFNEYMHLSWDNPLEERTKRIAPYVAELGAKYYVIDCGWHDDCDYKEIYQKVGKWQPSTIRFPNGMKNIVNYIKSLGMKAGLWIEPEIIGCECDEMEKFYGDDCFMYRNGKKIVTSNRKFLDFRKEKVRNYLSETIERMVGYGISYIKFDYNQDCGAGTEKNSDSLGDGLMECSNAFLSWVSETMDKFPNVIIEACASGGQRLDYKTLSLYTIASTSDQTNYLKYPYIAGNILSAVLPEQAAVWSYPVNTLGVNSFDDNEANVNARISKEQVVMNMVNSMLGRMHLASAVDLLNEEKRNLIKEGIKYYNEITAAKKISVPYLPWGFTDFYKDKVVSGFVALKKIYLAVWNLGGDGKFAIPINEYVVKNANIVYPSYANEAIKYQEHLIDLVLNEKQCARFIEIEIE